MPYAQGVFPRISTQALISALTRITSHHLGHDSRTSIPLPPFKIAPLSSLPFFSPPPPPPPPFFILTAILNNRPGTHFKKKKKNKVFQFLFLQEFWFENLATNFWPKSVHASHCFILREGYLFYLFPIFKTFFRKFFLIHIISKSNHEFPILKSHVTFRV